MTLGAPPIIELRRSRIWSAEAMLPLFVTRTHDSGDAKSGSMAAALQILAALHPAARDSAGSK